MPTNVVSALARLRDSPRVVVALRDAELLSAAAVRSTDPARDARSLSDAVDHGDDVTAIAAIHALAAVADPWPDQVLADLLDVGEQPMVGHAAWALAARQPSTKAVDLLHGVLASGGFAAMLAERTLIEWSLLAPERVTAPSLAAHQMPTDRSHLSRRHLTDGLVVVQPFLHARIDEMGSFLGAGDAGGIASLLRSLGTSLAQLDTVDEVITVTRAEPDRHGNVSLSGFLGEGHRIERIPYGTASTVPWREAWQYRVLLERELYALGRALGDRRVVWHLRMADVGTLAASAVARRLGHRVVFTAAADPHVLIDALEAAGHLDRSRFGVEDAAYQYWFRARMVERLSAQVDHLALMPRPDGYSDLINLVGLDPADLNARADIVPEGVDVAAVDAALARRSAGTTPVVEAVLNLVPASRRSIPWIVTVGRLHPNKGPHRLVAAVASRPDLIARFNVIIVGGELDDPSPDERSTLELIRDASEHLAGGSDRGAIIVVGHLPPSDVCDLLVHAAEASGVYVCASDKEEFGLAIVEALAAGVVAVGPRRGGPCTYIDDSVNGILCDTSSIASLGDAIERAAAMTDDPVRIETSRAFVRAELSIDSMARRLGDIYTRVVPAVATVP